MTEKKYMKPSEYLFNEDFMILNDDYKLKVINKLDKRFIDREELRNKILRKFDYYEDNCILDYLVICDSWDTNLVYLEIKEEILGMLK